ncbi:hypothetical protein [Ornithinicoccus hortensis]|uniref:Uncharacterized protein n=1 Tax=Ornithinicoccus hortensis TaxID=82346 RepID=A0A542YRQ3_9MICO|nr:hypothetical protein [Ornithinicoccus hortensis]TQL50782.1 hypothetical protein FB467_1899 [Ornithinicoccus hortensis]
MNPLTTSPEDLRDAARMLGRAVDEVGRFSVRVDRLECGTAGSWQGLAGIGQRSRMQSLRRSVHAWSGPLGDLAGTLAVTADHVEGSRERYRVLLARQETARHEVTSLRAGAGEPTDPVAEAERARRIEELERLLGRITASLHDEESALDRLLDTVRSRVEQAWPDDLSGDLQTLIRVAAGVGGAWSGLQRLRRGGQLLWTVERARWVDLSVRLGLVERGQRLARALARAPWWSRWAGGPGIWAIPLTIIPTAARDLVTGGGYDGPRGAVTRVSGAVAIPASILLVVPVPEPRLKAVSAISLGAYGLWKGGNAVWDRREVIPPLAGAVWEEARRRAEDLAEGLRPVVLGPLTPWAPELGGDVLDWVRERVDDLAGRVDGESTGWREFLNEVVEHYGDVPLTDLPDLPDPEVTWDDLLRDVGPWIGVPHVPIDTGPRLPVIPPWLVPLLPAPGR